MSEEEQAAKSLQELYTKAANAKRSLSRSKKDLQLGLKALHEAPSSSHFFDELVKSQTIYRERRIKVYDIYDSIEDQISDELFKKDFGKQCKEIEKDYDVLEEEARVAISRHHQAVADISANISRAGGAGGAGGAVPGGGAPRWKLQSSFEPKPPLKLDMGGEELANWERQFKIYFDISNLGQADIGTQRAVLQNCLHTDLQVKLHVGISGIPDIKSGLTLIRDEFQRRHPRVVRRHHLFSIEQRKDEYSFSDTVTRLDALARDADLTDMTKDSILCHLMLRACRDDDLRAKMLEVKEPDMTQVRLNEVIELYETIQRTNRGLGEKEKAKRAKASDSSICYRCQGRGHFASDCAVPEKSLFCETCSENKVPLPHSHNSFPGCKGKKKEEEKKEEEEKKKEEKQEVGKTKRTKARGHSPAGEPESSDSDDENITVRRVKTGSSTEDNPAGSPSSSDDDEDEVSFTTMTDSGWASSTTEEEEEKKDIYPVTNADFVKLKVRSYVAADPETSPVPADPRSKEKGLSAMSPQGRAPVLERVEGLRGEEMQRYRLEYCNPKLIFMAVLLLTAGLTKWLKADEPTNNVDTKISGDNDLMMASFVTFLMSAAFTIYRCRQNEMSKRQMKKKKKKEKDKTKRTGRSLENSD